MDAEVADLLETTKRQRLTGQSLVARALSTRRWLAEGIGESDALDVIYTLMSPEVHRILTVERKWSADRYERWLADTLCAALLPADRPGHPTAPHQDHEDRLEH